MDWLWKFLIAAAAAFVGVSGDTLVFPARNVGFAATPAI